MVSRRTALLGLAAALAGLAAWAASTGYFNSLADLAPPRPLRGEVRDHGTCLVYIPSSLPAGRKVPLVLALSPGADAETMIRIWAPVAETRGWLVAASKEFRNGVAWSIVTPQVMAELDAVERAYPVDSDKVVLAGLSGGAMGSLGITYYHPQRVRALVLNTGKMEEAFQDAHYPHGKLAVFLASPTDFRYAEMKRDRQFLTDRGWTTAWMEFKGGHVFAPPTHYQAAAAWLEKHW